MTHEWTYVFQWVNWKCFNLCLGIVNKKSVSHISCLVHKRFHVAIPRPTEETDEEWLWSSVNVGDQVTFSVEACDFRGSLPYIRGKLINLRYAFVWYKYISQDGWVSKVSGYRIDSKSSLCGRSMDSCLWCDVRIGSSLFDLLYKGVQGLILRSTAVKVLMWPATSFVAEVKNLWVFAASLLIGLHGVLFMHKASFTAQTTFILWMTLYCTF
jgi:hypothetical protein